MPSVWAGRTEPFLKNARHLGEKMDLTKRFGRGVRKLEYIEWARKVVDGLRGANAMLEKQFDEAARAAQQSLVPAL
jgi:hypothetical protein